MLNWFVISCFPSKILYIAGDYDFYTELVFDIQEYWVVFGSHEGDWGYDYLGDLISFSGVWFQMNVYGGA